MKRQIQQVEAHQTVDANYLEYSDTARRNSRRVLRHWAQETKSLHFRRRKRRNDLVRLRVQRVAPPRAQNMKNVFFLTVLLSLNTGFATPPTVRASGSDSTATPTDGSPFPLQLEARVPFAPTAFA